MPRLLVLPLWCEALLLLLPLLLLLLVLVLLINVKVVIVVVPERPCRCGSARCLGGRRDYCFLGVDGVGRCGSGGRFEVMPKLHPCSVSLRSTSILHQRCISGDLGVDRCGGGGFSGGIGDVMHDAAANLITLLRIRTPTNTHLLLVRIEICEKEERETRRSAR